MNNYLVVLSACADVSEAERIATALVDEKLAACVQILPAMRSIYRWRGKVETAEEHLLLIKTSENKLEELKARILGMHSYEVPEIVAIPVVAGSAGYLEWLGTALGE